MVADGCALCEWRPRLAPETLIHGRLRLLLACMRPDVRGSFGHMHDTSNIDCPLCCWQAHAVCEFRRRTAAHPGRHIANPVAAAASPNPSAHAKAQASLRRSYEASRAVACHVLFSAHNFVASRSARPQFTLAPTRCRSTTASSYCFQEVHAWHGRLRRHQYGGALVRRLANPPALLHERARADTSHVAKTRTARAVLLSGLCCRVERSGTA